MSETTSTAIVTEIADTSVSLQRNFAEGSVLTAAQALILDTAYVRQFTNNQNALAKARTEGKNTTPQPTAEELSALFASYEPNVGGTRMGGMEKLRNDAAWRVFLARVNDHNADVASGGQGLFPGASAGKPFTVPTGKGAPEWREKIVANVLSSDRYADKVESELAVLIAERKSNSKASGAVKPADVVIDDLI